jgi:hypothetical protein
MKKRRLGFTCIDIFTVFGWKIEYSSVNESGVFLRSLIHDLSQASGMKSSKTVCRLVSTILSSDEFAYDTGL